MYDLDVLTFHALVAALDRLDHRRKYEEAWTYMIAAQGKKESMDNWTKMWLPAVEAAMGNQEFSDKNDAAEFMQKLGKKLTGGRK